MRLLQDASRYDEALEILERVADYTQRGGFGPWSQLVNEGLRLQILAVRGNRRLTRCCVG